MNVIHVKNLVRQFGKAMILDHLDLDIQSGEIVSFLGSSGAGKTTLIKLLIGMDQPTQGEIEIFGKKSIDHDTIHKIGYMEQRDALYENLSALENLEYFGALYDYYGERFMQQAQKVLEVTDLTDHQHKLVKFFSGGMKRRLSLAITLLHDPEIIVLDEPTTGIDPVLRNHFWEEFRHRKAQGKTIFLTTHTMSDVDLSDRVYILRQGKILTSGSPTEIKDKAKAQSMEDAFVYYVQNQEASI